MQSPQVVITSKSIMYYYEKAIQAIIRPPKKPYHIDSLGPMIFATETGKIMRRINQQIRHGNEIIEVSIFVPYDQNNPSYIPPNIILFCHCNASNRLECMQYLNYLPSNYGIAGFDFIGCGNAKGDYITLGIRESQQIKTIVKVLQKQFCKIILWGRSMGAVSVLMYGEAAISIVDSPFSSMKELGKDQVKTHTKGAPSCLISCIFPFLWSCIKNDIKKRANVNINDLNTIDAVRRMKPDQIVVFIASRHDSLVSPSHTEKLYNAFPGKKKGLIMVDGDHNTHRNQQIFAQVMRMIDLYNLPTASVIRQLDYSGTLTNLKQ